MNADQAIKDALYRIKFFGDKIHTRNHDSLSNTTLSYTFDSFPLVTIRKTAVRKAIREMEWFMSGKAKCPPELLDWWGGQLNRFDELEYGYPHQFRNFGGHGPSDGFDQVRFILDGLRRNPNSRRLVMTVWHPEDMAEITHINGNPRTPTCCHSTLVQFFVREGRVHMTSYQRSADILLGVPHNWVQSWAMLMYFAKHSGHGIGSMRWIFGDCHLYTEESHIRVAESMMEAIMWELDADLVYSAPPVLTGVPEFRALDFSVVGDVPKPQVTEKPRLLI